MSVFLSFMGVVHLIISFVTWEDWAVSITNAGLAVALFRLAKLEATRG